MRPIFILTFAILVSVIACKKGDPTPVVPNPQDSTQHQPQDTIKHPEDTTQHPQLTTRQILDSAYKKLNGKSFRLEYFRYFSIFRTRDSANGPITEMDSSDFTSYDQHIVNVMYNPNAGFRTYTYNSLRSISSDIGYWNFLDTIYVNSRGEKFIATLNLIPPFRVHPMPTQASFFSDYRLYNQMPVTYQEWYQARADKEVEIQYYFEKDSISIYKLGISGSFEVSPPALWHYRNMYVGYGKSL